MSAALLLLLQAGWLAGLQHRTPVHTHQVLGGIPADLHLCGSNRHIAGHLGWLLLGCGESCRLFVCDLVMLPK